jgi:hypothetical protein
MALSYLSQDDIMDWAPWFWVLLAFQWTAEQGRALPPLALAWRSEPCDLPAHWRTLIAAWFPTATAITANDNQGEWTMTWRDTRWMAWRTRLQAPDLSRDQRRDLARACAVWHHTLQARIHGEMQRDSLITIRLLPDGLSWTQGDDNDWQTSPLLLCAHWLQSLGPLFEKIPLEEAD